MSSLKAHPCFLRTQASQWTQKPMVLRWALK